jgi:hypothetical protein
VIVVLSVGLGFFNEYRAEKAMAALRAQIRQEAEVRRDGRMSRVPVTGLVPGDVVSLRIGALVPADLRLLEVDELECDEGVLTGESMPVAKSVAPVADGQSQEQPGCAFMGTVVHQGSATQTLVVYVIRTRRVPFFKSRPSLPMLLVPTGAALAGAILPYTGLARLLGFTRPCPQRSSCCCSGWWSSTCCWSSWPRPASTASTAASPAPGARDLPPSLIPNGWSETSGAGHPGSSATRSHSPPLPVRQGPAGSPSSR